MSNIAIRVEHLSKMYRLGVINNGTLWRDMQTYFALMRGKEDPHSKIGKDRYLGDNDHFWALKDISFDIQQGDRIGIVGKNGAGKSTLLKILSRITTPTEGKVLIKGKIASLLEVGTGFHGELSGRENIYLNGAILGMKKRQIDKKIDEIIDFSEIERHIDTPVKRYSSGMYVRLAFAVGAHLDSDILIADEVLAVGDANFQKKAIGKMNDISYSQGKTVIFVSHQMQAVSRLCNKGVVLDQGRIAYNADSINSVIKYYMSNNRTDMEYVWVNKGEIKNEYCTPLEMYVSDEMGSIIKNSVGANEKVYVNIIFEVDTLNPLLKIEYRVFDEEGVILFLSESTDMPQENWPTIKKGINHYTAEIPCHFLNEGKYNIAFGAVLHETLAIVNPLMNPITINFEISGGLSDSPYWNAKRLGVNAPLISWSSK